MMTVLSGTGLYLPPETLTNDELVGSFNAYVDQYNQQHAADIACGKREALGYSSAEFIAKASGVESRHVIDKQGILDVATMRPQIQEFDEQGRSIQAQMAVAAAQKAMEAAHIGADEIQMVIASCSGFQRCYPAIAIEVQAGLGIEGFAYDMNVACSSVTFALFNAVNAIKAGAADSVLVVNPEVFTSQVDFRDRKSHFLFGDAATAFIVQRKDKCRYEHAFEIVDYEIKTLFSANIENNLGITNAVDTSRPYFIQDGNKVFKEVIKLTTETIKNQLTRLELEGLKRLWLHQANSNMIRLISNKLLGHNPNELEAPQPIKYCGNTSSCGAMIAFHENHQDMVAGDLGLLATFGAGYSLGSVVLRKA